LIFQFFRKMVIYENNFNEWKKNMLCQYFKKYFLLIEFKYWFITIKMATKV
jgi:hypothetical protein